MRKAAEMLWHFLVVYYKLLVLVQMHYDPVCPHNLSEAVYLANVQLGCEHQYPI